MNVVHEHTNVRDIHRSELFEILTMVACDTLISGRSFTGDTLMILNHCWAGYDVCDFVTVCDSI